MKSGTCVVTGAAGFIGSHLVDELLSMEFRVIGLDNLALGKKNNLSKAFQSRHFSFRPLDVNDYEGCLAYLREECPRESIDMVWHMAANSDIQAGVADPDVDLRLTFLSTYNVVKLMRTLGIPKIAFASSSAIYGEHAAALQEDSGPLFPISSYGAMKLASEGVISAALEHFLKQAWIFRFPNVVGSRSTHGVIYDFIQKLRKNPQVLDVLGNGAQEKPYLHVSELVQAMICIFQKSHERLNYYNIAPSGTATTVRYIAEAVVKAASPGGQIRYSGGSKGWVGDVATFSYSIEKLQTLGWSPKLTSNEAVELAIQENLQPEVQ